MVGVIISSVFVETNLYGQLPDLVLSMNTCVLFPTKATIPNLKEMENQLLMINNLLEMKHNIVSDWQIQVATLFDKNKNRG
jgi:hypothetical protein